MILVRPDQYVSTVPPLDVHPELNEFLGQVLIEATSPEPSRLAARRR
jgi:hypothetical protein